MRLARPGDRSALTALWHACFGDPEDVISGFFDAVEGKCSVFVTDDISAMLTAMPVTWQQKPAAYLYAVATHPDHQGKGLCRRLMAFAEHTLKEQGCSYALLSPAEPSLFGFYEKLGYETVFFSEKKTFSGTGSALPVCVITSSEYTALRERRMPDGVQYPEFLLQLQASMGQLLRIGTDGCAAMERHGDRFVIRELLSDEPEAAASSLCRYYGVREISVKLPGDQPYGMAKSLDGSPLRRSWLGLAFE